MISAAKLLNISPQRFYFSTNSFAEKSTTSVKKIQREALYTLFHL